MLDPVLKETDTIRRGAGYLRNYHTGTLDTTNYTPHATFMERKTGNDAGYVQMSRLDGFNWALVISRDVSSTLDPYAKYILNVDFDAADGATTIPHGQIAIDVSQGAPR